MEVYKFLQSSIGHESNDNSGMTDRFPGQTETE